MSTHSLPTYLAKAQEDGSAIAHFNVSDLVMLKAVFSAAQDLQQPVIVGASGGEREFLGVRQLAAYVQSLRTEVDFPIFLNSDHTHSLEEAVEAASAGFDSIVFDLSALSFEDNIRETRQAVEVLKGIHPGIIIEGEIGDIGTGSEIHEGPADAPKAMTTPAEAKQYVEATGVDMLAPAVGNSHGLSKSMAEGTTKKRLDIERIAEIQSAAQVPLTLHGGSGTADEDLRRAIAAGIRIVHINTELRVAWRRGLEKGLSTQPSQVVPYKILPFAVESVKEVALARMQLIGQPHK